MNDTQKAEIIRDHYKQIGQRGGRAGRGKKKARTTKQARAAALSRWNRKVRENTKDV